MISYAKSYATIDIRTTNDIVTGRRKARALAAALGFGMADQTRLATAVSELARNVVEYAGSGSCEIIDASDAIFHCVTVIVQDNGPGIADIDSAMRDGFSTGGSLGAGLPGTRRLADSFMIESKPGLTRITISFSLRKESL
ncbi:anti-sigma regulatory factor [Herbaspirillum sp. RTI4]|uniref:anti-sigma regulatory factor n=1 Tax=Herbaspirillum sp. RTI4 TaxID=3048640 RepID=UPI002AB3F2E4|nr:anti-sigma regulatory factor [Herbaspirillum sp. RTI4]MDY7579159.1 anti-sigma regulatory factor [Herbaspirillum sp. RTI4]MEA9981262.1 anti-sigma regulatory factor [Herbaspirillum sp. RTI4]